MFVMPQNVILIDGIGNKLRHWSVAFLISLLVNIAFFYVLTIIILSKHDIQQVKKYIPIVLGRTALVQAVEIPVPLPLPAVTAPPKPAIAPQPKPLPKIKPLKRKENKSPSPSKPTTKVVAPVVEEELLQNRQKVEDLVGEAIAVPSNAIGFNRKPVPLFRLTRQPGGIEGEPQYPKTAEAMGREASVMASVLVDIDGKVIEVDIVESGGKEFDQAVIDWLVKQQLSPGYVDGTPVVSRINQSFKFVLR